METTHGKTHSENGEGECWWSRIASPYPDANNVAPPATNDEEEYRTRSLSRCNRRLLHALTTTAQPPFKRRKSQTTGGAHGAGRRSTRSYGPHQRRRRRPRRLPTSARRSRRWRLHSSPSGRASAPVPAGEGCTRCRGHRSAYAGPSCPASSQGRGRSTQA